MSRFAEPDLSLDVVSDQEMGREYEELVRRLIDVAPEESGEHPSPQDVTALAVRLLLGPEAATLHRAGPPMAVHDPCCGTGGMFTAVEDFLPGMESPAEVTVFDGEITPPTEAIKRLQKIGVLQKGSRLDSRAVACLEEPEETPYRTST
ncbi:N-6 DNA methylase [Streptomyces sp. NPDC006458]|uniref:N-6 DNA methylase n=1 Tax=Streptomyces sp. NPDC006458 TaxID=3154302 RepID=UPI0033A44C9A